MLLCSSRTKRACVCRCACLWAWRWCVSSLAPVRCSGGVSPTSSALSALWRAQGLWWGMSYPGVCMWMRFASSWCLSFLLYIVSSALVLSGALMNRNKKERKTTRPCSDRCDCCRQPLFYAIPPFASHPLRRRRDSPPLVPPRTVEQPPRVVGPPRKRGRRPPALPVIVGEANPRGRHPRRRRRRLNLSRVRGRGGHGRDSRGVGAARGGAPRGPPHREARLAQRHFLARCAAATAATRSSTAPDTSAASGSAPE